MLLQLKGKLSLEVGDLGTPLCVLEMFWGKEYGIWDKIQIPAPMTNCVALGKSHNLSEFLLPHRERGGRTMMIKIEIIHCFVRINCCALGTYWELNNSSIY